MEFFPLIVQPLRVEDWSGSSFKAGPVRVGLKAQRDPRFKPECR